MIKYDFFFREKEKKSTKNISIYLIGFCGLSLSFYLSSNHSLADCLARALEESMLLSFWWIVRSLEDLYKIKSKQMKPTDSPSRNQLARIIWINSHFFPSSSIVILFIIMIFGFVDSWREADDVAAAKRQLLY